MAKTYYRRGYKRFSDSGKSVARHVASRKLYRPLRNTERVHHINRDKSDNRRSNLWVFKTKKNIQILTKETKKYLDCGE